jgi:hypothetical protein
MEMGWYKILHRNSYPKKMQTQKLSLNDLILFFVFRSANYTN